MHEKNLNNLFEDVIKKLKKVIASKKSVKVNDNTIVNGSLSPFDSVSFMN